MKKYIITVLAHPRTGTNYLMCFLEKFFPHFNVNFEIFNPQNCFMNEKYITGILEKYHLVRNSTNQNKLVKLAREGPILFLRNLIEISQEEVIIHKIFPHHLTNHQLQSVLCISDLVLVVDRKFLDVFISLEKTKYLLERKVENPWILVDTTDIKINVDPKQFERDLKIYQIWYRDNYITLQNLQVPVFQISYEIFHQLDSSEKINHLREIFQNFIPPEFLKVKTKDSNLLHKQDRILDFSQKIINYSELVELGFFKNYN